MLSKIKEHFQNGGLLEVLKFVLLRIRFCLFERPKQKRKKKKQEKHDAIYCGPINMRGMYRSHSFVMPIERTLSKIFMYPVAMRNRNARIAIVLHFFYNKSIDEVIQYLKNVKFSYKFDLYVTMPKDINYDFEIKKIYKLKKDAKIIRCDNNGYDIGPFLDVLNGINLNKYDIVIKLQTKSTNKSIYVYSQFFQNRDWFCNLWRGIIGPLNVHKTIKKLYKNRRNGVVAAKNLIINDPKHKQELVKETLSKYKKINFIDNYFFVAGSCFAIKAKCLKTIQSLGLSATDFEKTKYGFFSLAHVVERAICFSIMPKYRFSGNRSGLWRKMKWYRLEKRLYKKSMLRIAENPKYDISPDFVWMVLELRFMEKFEEKKIKINKIKREYFDGAILNLEECEPYKYLCGDKAAYKKYIKYQREHNLPFMSIERFDSLIKSIKENGYLANYPIIIDEHNIVWDGQHRACVLLKEHGPDYMVDVLKIYRKDINLDNAKPFSRKIDGIII